MTYNILADVYVSGCCFMSEWPHDKALPAATPFRVTLGLPALPYPPSCRAHPPPPAMAPSPPLSHTPHTRTRRRAQRPLQAQRYSARLYPDVPAAHLSWASRLPLLVAEVATWAPDVLCLQEVDKFTDLYAQLKPLG